MLKPGSTDQGVVVYELWIENSGYRFFSENDSGARSLLEPGAKLLWTTTAHSWSDAKQRKDEFLGLAHTDAIPMHQDENLRINVNPTDISPVIDLIKLHQRRH